MTFQNYKTFAKKTEYLFDMEQKKERKPRALKYGEEQVRINEMLPKSGEPVIREMIKFIRETKEIKK